MTLIQAVRSKLRTRGYSPATEKAYVDWVKRFIRFHRNRHPREMGAAEVREFLEHLVLEGRVAPSTQKQALNALAFLYGQVLEIELGDLGAFQRAKGRRHLPTVASPEEVWLVLEQMTRPYLLMAKLMYGSGLRLREVCSLRVKDIDLSGRCIEVRHGKGGRDRVTLLPDAAVEDLRAQLGQVKALHQKDVARGRGHAPLPNAFGRKSPGAARSLEWQFLFPASRLCRDEASSLWVRPHLHPTAVQRELRAAGKRSGVQKRITCHTLRHSFATTMLEAGVSIRCIQRLMGHARVSTTSIYLHVMRKGLFGLVSPLDMPRRITNRSIDVPDLPDIKDKK